MKTFLISKKAQLNLLKLDSQDAAKQLTIIDSGLFRMIQPADILSRKNVAIARRFQKVCVCCLVGRVLVAWLSVCF
jgi:hypothetical protein